MSPEEYADTIYWKFSEDEELSNEQVNKCCNKALDFLYNESEELERFYWNEVRAIINMRNR